MKFQSKVESVDELRALIGVPAELIIRKQLSALDEHMAQFIEMSPFALLGTVSRSGRCDVSPRGDFPSVAKVIDEKTLVIADRRGNKRLDSLLNIVETNSIGILFLRPGIGETLRVNGKAWIIRDDAIREEFTMKGVKPDVVIGVEVEECFFHCAKAILRSSLWNHTSFANNSGQPAFDFAQTLADETKIEGQTVQEIAEMIECSYRERLY
ncbi:MAG: MSMEG_1061 family FMN-dependent PPOX-type flavoprotein [Pirellula sp.]